MIVLRFIFFYGFIKPVALIMLGLNVRHFERYPRHGPVVVIANHNSHLDTLVLMSLFPFRVFEQLRPIAAVDYFMSNPLMAWFSTNILQIIPMERRPTKEQPDPLLPCVEALDTGKVLLFFPEGSRGYPEHMAEFKQGISHLMERKPDVPVVPVFLHGCGKALPKGEALFVPFFCDVFIGEPIRWNGGRKEFAILIQSSMTSLASEGNFATWD